MVVYTSQHSTLIFLLLLLCGSGCPLGADAQTESKTALERIWETLSQHLQQQQSKQQQQQQQQQQDTDEPPDHHSLAAPHVSTRGGPGVSHRRRALLHRSLHQHWDNDSSLQTNNTTTQSILDTYFYEPSFNQPPPDRTASLHHAFPPFTHHQTNLQTLKNMFTHAYDSYMLHAWPWYGEVEPVTCQPRQFDLIPLPALTLLDSLDTLVLLQNTTELVRAVERLRQFHTTQQHLFHVDDTVSVFEITIRVLGGLLSAHQWIVAYMTTTTATKPATITVPLSHVFDTEGNVKWGYTDEEENSNNYNTANTVHNNNNNIMEKDETTQSPCIPATTSAPCAFSFLDSFHAQQDMCLLVDNNSNKNDNDTRMCGLRHCNTTTTRTTKTFQPPLWQYDNFLLELAEDLGRRLLPAFDTRTGIPYGTIHLQSGTVPTGETTVASLAGGGTLSLEFELLSRLTGNATYGQAAKLATRALWTRRSPRNLLGKHIDVHTGHWTETLSGIGSNSDSFVEYLVKHYVLFPDDAPDFWDMLTTVYQGVYDHARLGEWYVDTDMYHASKKSRHVLESLMAFYPGMQVLLGEIAPAARSLNSFFIVRELLGFLPERFHFGHWKVDAKDASVHPLRPELLESCYFLHRATARNNNNNNNNKQSFSGWQWAADFALRQLQTLTRTQCGYSGLSHLHPATTGSVDGLNQSKLHYTNEMPSFFLSETIKYLYLIFDNDNILHRDQERQWVFTTEAHPVHYVPPLQPQNDASAWSDEVDSLKDLLRNRLADQDASSPPKPTTPNYPLIHEKWTTKTSYLSYIRDIEQSRRKRQEYHNATDASARRRSRFFGDHYPLLDSFVAAPFLDTFGDTLPERNFAHTALSNTGLGHGGLRKACPNLHQTDLLWMHALNGGAMDYSDSYVSVTSDKLAEHPISFLALGAADALGRLKTGMYLGLPDTANDKTCPVPGSEPQKPAATDKKETPAEPGKDISQFEVTTFSDGGGFVVDHLPTGDKVINSFVFDEISADKIYVMVYAGYSLHPNAVPTKVPAAGALWRMAGGQRTATSYSASDAEPSFWRKVVMADFEGNSFSCTVELFLTGDDVSDKEILATIPCAPGMFGRTHVSSLREGDGIVVEAAIASPPEGDELGCMDEDDVDAQANETVGFDQNDIVNVDENPDEESSTDNSATAAGSIQVVHRGECTFFSKAMNMKNQRRADAVIVINTEDDELFVMSHGDPSEQKSHNVDPNDVPVTVLVTGLDGEDLLSIANGEVADGGTVVARVSLRREQSELSTGGKLSTVTNSHRWPIVRGSAEHLQILAKGGWGIQAVRSGTKPLDWSLHLLQYQETD